MPPNDKGRPKGALEETRPRGHGRARGLTSSRVSGSRVEAGTFAAPTAVASVVGGLWWGRWDLRGQRDHVTELLGDPCVHVVCERGDDGDVARVVGVWSRLWTRRLTGRGQVRGLKLRIGAAAQLLPVPARQVTDRRVPLEELFPETRGLASAVMSAPREEGLQVLVAWARTMLRPTVEGQEVIALAEGIGPAGVLRVDELAERSGRTVRWLQRRFRHHVGLSPKAVKTHVRMVFEHSFSALLRRGACVQQSEHVLHDTLLDLRTCCSVSFSRSTVSMRRLNSCSVMVRGCTTI